jgi:hypothetical protein
VGDERVREGLETDDESNSRILKKEGRTNRKKDTFSILPLQAPAPTGAFYIFNDDQSIKNALQYLASSPTYSANLEPLCLPKTISDISTRSKASHLHYLPLLIHLSPQRFYQILR